jgi:hypothetical protein
MKIFRFTVITRCFFGNYLNAAKVCFRLLKVQVDVKSSVMLITLVQLLVYFHTIRLATD